MIRTGQRMGRSRRSVCRMIGALQNDAIERNSNVPPEGDGGLTFRDIPSSTSVSLIERRDEEHR